MYGICPLSNRLDFWCTCLTIEDFNGAPRRCRDQAHINHGNPLIRGQRVTVSSTVAAPSGASMRGCLWWGPGYSGDLASHGAPKLVGFGSLKSCGGSSPGRRGVGFVPRTLVLPATTGASSSRLSGRQPVLPLWSARLVRPQRQWCRPHPVGCGTQWPS